MKALPALILLIGFSWTQFYNSVVLGVYELNKTEYIADFCENQDEPELKCDGKCHLSKQLVDTQKEPQENEPPTLIPEQELFTYQFNINESEVFTRKGNIPFYSPFYTQADLSRLEHPPKA
jgi:hypothetical protein